MRRFDADDNLHEFDPEDLGDDPGADFVTAFVSLVNVVEGRDPRLKQGAGLLRLTTEDITMFMGEEAGQLTVLLSAYIGLRLQLVNLIGSLREVSGEELVKQLATRKTRDLLPLFAVTPTAEQFLDELIQTPKGASLYVRMTFGLLAGYRTAAIRPLLLSEVK